MNTNRQIDHVAIIKKWIAAANAFAREEYLDFFTADVVLDDPSVGRKFNGKAGIGKYFDAYFVGYNTRTRLLRIEPEADHFHVSVRFTGDFPGGKTNGIFDITFKNDKMAFVRADLSG